LRTIPLIQTAGATTFREGGCISCHSGNIVTAAVAEARRKGLPIDNSAHAENVRATRLQFLAPAESMLERSDPPVSLILSFSLFSLAEADAAADRVIDAMVNNLAATQLADGTWPWQSILRPPTSDSLFSGTAQAILAFRRYAPPARQREFDERVARAVRALESAEPTTTEDRVMQLLGLKWAGADQARLDRLSKALVALQRADGGWAQTPPLATDAYATGTVLDALYRCGIAADSPAYRKGVAFLLKTQAPDGSWHVVSRAPKFQPYFEGGFPYGHDQWISQWGTGWAAIALTHAMPDQRAALR
jgi:N-acyl-D-amino-acid deacylase